MLICINLESCWLINSQARNLVSFSELLIFYKFVKMACYPCLGSTDTVPEESHPCPTLRHARDAAAYASVLRLTFFSRLAPTHADAAQTRADSHWIGLICADSGHIGSYRVKSPKCPTVNSCRNSITNPNGLISLTHSSVFTSNFSSLSHSSLYALCLSVHGLWLYILLLMCHSKNILIVKILLIGHSNF